MKTMTPKCLCLAVAAFAASPVVAAPAEEALAHTHVHNHNDAHAHAHDRTHGNSDAVFMTEKLTAPIGISYELADQPAAGVPLTIHLSITVASAQGSAQLQLLADDGLLLLDAPASQALGELSPESGARLSVTVLPEHSSRLRVSVTAGSGSASSLFRNVSIPVRLPDNAAAEKIATRSDHKSESQGMQRSTEPDGAADEVVHSFRARETIR